MGDVLEQKLNTVKFKKILFGEPAVFFIPAMKINDPKNKSLAEGMHDFLITEFGGYTSERGNILGYWREKASTDYTEHVKYIVAFKSKAKLRLLEKFIAELAKKLDEKAIYMETGNSSWLIYTQ